MNKSLEKRIEQSKNILKKYPNRIPIILIKYSNRDPDLDKYKYLASNDMPLSALLYHIRKRTKLKQDQAIFLSVNGIIYHSNELLKNIYDKNKDLDNFLYITYSIENTFG